MSQSSQSKQPIINTIHTHLSSPTEPTEPTVNHIYSHYVSSRNLSQSTETTQTAWNAREQLYKKHQCIERKQWNNAQLAWTTREQYSMTMSSNPTIVFDNDDSSKPETTIVFGGPIVFDNDDSSKPETTIVFGGPIVFDNEDSSEHETTIVFGGPIVFDNDDSLEPEFVFGDTIVFDDSLELESANVFVNGSSSEPKSTNIFRSSESEPQWFQPLQPDYPSVISEGEYYQELTVAAQKVVEYYMQILIESCGTTVFGLWKDKIAKQPFPFVIPFNPANNQIGNFTMEGFINLIRPKPVSAKHHNQAFNSKCIFIEDWIHQASITNTFFNNLKIAVTGFRFLPEYPFKGDMMPVIKQKLIQVTFESVYV
jgi:hypothetical protein